MASPVRLLAFLCDGSCPHAFADYQRFQQIPSSEDVKVDQGSVIRKEEGHAALASGEVGQELVDRAADLVGLGLDQLVQRTLEHPR